MLRETSQFVGRLVADDIGLNTWKGMQQRFEELYWSELTIVEHAKVASAMAGFRTVLLAVFEKRSKLSSGQFSYDTREGF
jgi:hypothetical protein